MSKHFIYTALLCCCASLCTFNCSASYLANELAMKPESSQFWRSRVNNLLSIEENLMRRKRFNKNAINYLNDYVNDGNLDKLNHFINYFEETSTATYNTRDTIFLNHKKYIKKCVEHLPVLETDVYRGQTISPRMWQKINQGEGYFVKSFYSGTGSLHLAHADARNALNESANPLAKKLIIKIKGKKSRLANVFYQNEHADFLWDEQTHFKIIGKDYNPETETYFLHLNEIPKAQASKLSRVLNAHDGTVKYLRSSNCS